MKRSKKAMLAAGLLAGAAAMTGCASNAKPVTSPTPVTNEQTTAEPAGQPESEASPQAESDAGGESGPIALRVDGQEAAMGALEERGTLLLPLAQTGKLLGWTVGEEQVEEETQARRSISLEREGSRITVAWVVSDNTIRQITWQRDGLLVPVDTALTSAGDDVIYAPAAFFEEAMDVRVDRVEDVVEVAPRQPKQTPPAQEGGQP